MPQTPFRSLVLLWLGWFLTLYSFQAVITARLDLVRPDFAVPWSATETTAASNRGKIYLLEPFMNRQVAWDAEYYVGIAVGGYDDPRAGAVDRTASGEPVNKNYSFFPLYPTLMRLVAPPFRWLGMAPIAAAVAAGLVITLLGTLAGMVALWHLTRDLLGEADADRAAFYLLIFPTAFFFAMVYTEGLFIGLAFPALWLSKRGRWVWASLLGMLAAWTRAHGVILVLPLLWAWAARADTGDLRRAWKNWEWWIQGLLALLPGGAYLVWRVSPLGQGWAELQPFYFGRGFLAVGRTIGSVINHLSYALTNSQAAVYFSLELVSVVLALVASIWLLKRDPPVALFGLAVVLLSLLSGSAQSLARYVLIAPPLYLFLAHLGRNRTVDRLWTLASILLLGMSTMLFAFDMWAG